MHVSFRFREDEFVFGQHGHPEDCVTHLWGCFADWLRKRWAASFFKIIYFLGFSFHLYSSRSSLLTKLTGWFPVSLKKASVGFWMLSRREEMENLKLTKISKHSPKSTQDSRMREGKPARPLPLVCVFQSWQRMCVCVCVCIRYSKTKQTSSISFPGWKNTSWCKSPALK